MIRFFLGNSSLRWRFEVRAVPIPRSEPQGDASLYDSYLAEVGAWSGDQPDHAGAAAGASADDRAW